jgi:hypothetical protein
MLPEPQRVELVAPLVQRLHHRRADAAALVAQQAQQADGRAPELQRRVEVGRHVRRLSKNWDVR